MVGGVVFDLDGLLRDLKGSTSTEAIFAPLRILVDVLDAVASLHPFAAIAIIPVKVIIELELNRRANDRRILTLVAQMAGMLQHLTTLPREKFNEEQAARVLPVLEAMEVT